LVEGVALSLVAATNHDRLQAVALGAIALTELVHFALIAKEAL
jgi:hypothetical protein